MSKLEFASVYMSLPLFINLGLIVAAGSPDTHWHQPRPRENPLAIVFIFFLDSTFCSRSLACYIRFRHSKIMAFPWLGMTWEYSRGTREREPPRLKQLHDAEEEDLRKALASIQASIASLARGSWFVASLD